MIFNTKNAYGVIAIAFHWLGVLLLPAVFLLGLWMTGLSYYDPYYTTAPWLHKSLGMLLLALGVLRLAWRLANPVPGLLGGGRWQNCLARSVHGLLYLLLLLVPVSGYLLSASSGQPVDVFGWVKVPALVRFDDESGWAATAHAVLAWLVVFLVLLHAAAAIKHHFIDRDQTLVRMLKPGKRG